MTRHSLSLLVENEAGALTRVVTLFSGRAVEVDSMSFDPTDEPGVARLDVVVGVRDDRGVEQLVKQLGRLVNVLRVVESAAVRAA